MHTRSFPTVGKNTGINVGDGGSFLEGTAVQGTTHEQQRFCRDQQVAAHPYMYIQGVDGYGSHQHASATWRILEKLTLPLRERQSETFGLACLR